MAWTLLIGQVSSSTLYTYIWTLVFKNLYKLTFIMNTSRKTGQLNCFWTMVFHISSTTKISDISRQFAVLFSGCNKLKHAVLLKINARVARYGHMPKFGTNCLSWRYESWYIVELCKLLFSGQKLSLGKEEGKFNSAPFFLKAQHNFITIYMCAATRALPVNYHSLSGRPTGLTVWHEMPTSMSCQ